MDDKKAHWETIYENKNDQEVSWYQPKPVTSLKLIQSINPAKKAAIIDIGGGNSGLISELQQLGFTNLSMLDISGKAIDRAKAKAPAPQKINWIVSDILDFVPTHQYFIWHDRATFHFLTNQDDIHSYIKLSAESIVDQGFLILSGFSTSGPKKCSGLDIKQYSAEKLKKLFSDYFILENSFEEIHETPFNSEQSFVFTLFRRVV